MGDSQRWTINSGSKFEEMAGYSRAVIDGEWIFVSGTAGFNFEDGSISDDAAEQARQALRTIRTTLEKADAGMSDIVRVRVYLADRADVVSVSKVLGETFSDPRPTNTTIICGFAEEVMKVELEVTALKR
ncbi:RidA family protein [Nitratireductor pacificus]|uniref:Putative translation initiation inhibitor n=1 Tax=Nitratireductor pacificus pht-3B TaxID=391937 RepID=K2MCW1_9HYPH|nr:RidA family protein [Nitratireductor pacificus]EKF18585.1 putative translation initiation inhibitor [Nitratireductor pacificus pht-3B]